MRLCVVKHANGDGSQAQLETKPKVFRDLCSLDPLGTDHHDGAGAGTKLSDGTRYRQATSSVNMKRIIDLLLASLGLLVAWPFMIAIAVAIRVSSRGPAIFVQERVGRNEVVFNCLKFRTMVHGSPNIASHNAASDWITPVGRFLRSTKLDELPQLINVVLGQMSLVGPRPCLPNQLELIGERRRLGVFVARPGITGAAQVAGIDMSNPGRLAQADAAYIESQTLFGDFRLMVLTVLGSGSGDAALK